MKITYNKLELLILILIIIEAFFESTLMFIFDTDIYSFSKLSKNTTTFIKSFYNVANLMYLFVSLYFLFIKKVQTFDGMILCIMLLLKAFTHFFVALNIYKNIGLNLETQKKILKFHDHEALGTSIIIMTLTTYSLYKIF